jgi:hypothetical protein
VLKTNVAEIPSTSIFMRVDCDEDRRGL